MTKKQNSKKNQNNPQDDIHVEEDLARGKAAFERMAPRMAALDDEELVVPNSNMAEGALAAIGVAARLAEPEIRARFELMSGPLFDMAHVNDLGDLAWATLHAARMADEARFLQSRARLSAELLEDATATRTRMQSCCTYYLSDHPDAGPKLVRLSAGTGYRDLADDLLGYAALYQEHEAVLAVDQKYYRASDREHAIRLGDRIYATLGSAYTEEVRSATDQLHRAWTLLLRSYGEVSALGRWLFRHDASMVERLFPSLIAVGRNGRSRRRADEPTPEPAEPAEPSPALV